ncbi:MAG TPA: IS701 family transposase [Pseudonocardiaceae bacterium]
MLGLLSGLERKNCWTIAEQRGQRSPDGLQHLLARARWDADAVRDDLRGYVVDAFGDDAAVLVVDETGDLKKGEKSVGVQRQYTGTAGRIENAQVAVYLTYAAPRGHAFIDRALYLPRSWADDQPRRDAAGVPADAAFATKPALATAMISRAVQAGVPAGWVAGDEVYGADPTLRKTVREHGLGYVLQVAANRRMPTHAGPRRVDTLPALIPESGWQTYSCGRGSKGHRDYAWAWIQLLPEPGDPDTSGEHHLLIRRNQRTGELAYLRCYTPGPTTLATLVKVAGQRWRIEESFQTGKGLVGLDQHQVRGWTSWHRWTTLAMLAHAFLAVATALERDHSPTPQGLIPLTVNEFRRLFDALLLAAGHTITSLLAWSTWRRRHQARARDSHYRRREQTQ